MQRKHLKKLVVGGALLASLGLMAGCETTDAKVSSPETETAEIFESVDVTVDAKNHEITLSGAVDSLVVGSLEALGGSKYFVATDDDPVDPSFDWDAELKEGSVIKFGDGNVVRIVVLDDENRTVAVWEVSFPEEKSSSSKDKSSSSSSEAADDEVSSSSAEEEDESSSSEEPVEESSSSEETAESSSSEEVVESSSSEEPVEESSSSEEIVESSSSEEVVDSSSSEIVEDSSSSEAVDESSSSEEVIESSTSADQPQLPGSSFDSWDKTFWGSTSDAMATKGYGIFNVVVDYDITMASEANAIFNNSKITLTTKSVSGTAAVGILKIEGGWKMAGGFYFAGSYTGADAASIYMADNKDAGADKRPADFSQYMKFGQPFEGHPVSFDVTYAYNHVGNTNNTYPQSSLIYVALVSADNKIVAAGKISDSASVEMGKKTVPLIYGGDAGLIADEAIGVKGLTLGTGDEEVVSIRVMFASSALAYVADGGTSSQMKKNFRGGEGSQLIIDEFKLNY